MTQAAATSPRPVVPSGPEGPKLLEATVAVQAVTLMEDRAMVSRRGVLTLPPGHSRLRIEGVAPVLVDKTLFAELRAESDEAVSDLRAYAIEVERKRVVQDADRPADLAGIRARLREERRIHEIDVGRRVALDDEIDSLARLVELTIAEINEDVGWGKADTERWRAQLDALDERRLALGQERCELEQIIARRERDIADLEALERASTHVEGRATAALIVDLLNETAEARHVELRVEYMVPGALWRPWHTARLVETPQGAEVVFRCDGCVWQCTGEDWRDVELVFSTERPSLGVSPPPLHTDRLRLRKKAATVDVSVRDRKVHTAGLGHQTGAPTEVARDDLPGVDDGGQVLELRGTKRATIAGDGRPHRVPLFEFRAPAETASICLPESVPAVVFRSRQVNRADHPILAGPVDSIRGGGFVGRTSVSFVASGERFDLGWGPDGNIRVHREVEELPPERKTLSAWTRKARRVRIRLSNLSSEPRTISLRERIPVSEIEKVEVELVETRPPASPDENGFLEWDLRLRELGHEEVVVRWTLVVHDDVSGL